MPHAVKNWEWLGIVRLIIPCRIYVFRFSISQSSRLLASIFTGVFVHPEKFPLKLFIVTTF